MSFPGSDDGIFEICEHLVGMFKDPIFQLAQLVLSYHLSIKLKSEFGNKNESYFSYYTTRVSLTLTENETYQNFLYDRITLKRCVQEV